MWIRQKRKRASDKLPDGKKKSVKNKKNKTIFNKIYIMFNIYP